MHYLRLLETLLSTIVLSSVVSEEFGSRDVEPSIVGGTPVTDVLAYSAYAIPNSSRYVCGATLIHRDVLISAAHCEGVFVGGVKLGTIQRKGTPLDTVETDFEFVHFGYRTFRFLNDVMLIKLKRVASNPIRPMEWNDDPSLIRPNTNVTTIGYGTTTFNGDLSPDLLQVSVLTYDDQSCRNAYTREYITRTQICAGTRSGGRDSCQGDSGGPLLSLINQSNPLLVGVVSYGRSCGLPDVPGVYARVSGFDDWIRSFICKYSSVRESYCPSLLQKEQAEEKAGKACPAVYECGARYRERFVVSFSFFGSCVTRCVPGGFRLRFYQLIGWKCGKCR